MKSLTFVNIKTAIEIENDFNNFDHFMGQIIALGDNELFCKRKFKFELCINVVSLPKFALIYVYKLYL